MVCCAVFAATLVAACGDESRDGTQRAQAGGEVGDAQIATNGSPDQVGRRSPGPDDDVVQGEPSLDQLDPSGPAPGAVGAPGTSCSGGDLVPSSGNLAQVARATLCLVNAERKSRGLSALRANRQLARAGLDHARDMVNRSYFAHETLGGGGFIGRIKARGYLSGRRSWTAGENLAWGGGATGSPRQIVTLWMSSPTHRANILNRRFRDAGLGIALGAPVRGGRASQAATYGNEFGIRGGR
jgi:uncharacterized protein YkwD